MRVFVTEFESQMNRVYARCIAKRTFVSIAVHGLCTELLTQSLLGFLLFTYQTQYTCFDLIALYQVGLIRNDFYTGYI